MSPLARRCAGLALVLSLAAVQGGERPAHAGLEDRRGVTVRISRSTDGMSANGNSSAQLGAAAFDDSAPAISADGRHIAFTSTASNLDLLHDSNTAPDVYVHDRDPDRNGVLDEPGRVLTRAITLDAAGRATGGSAWPAMSADGRYISYTSWAATLVSGDTNNAADVFVHDRDADGDGAFDETGQTRTVRVSVRSDGTEPAPRLGATPSSFSSSISADGRFVSFFSWGDLAADDTGTCWSPGDRNVCTDVYIHDRDADGDGIFDEAGAVATELVSVASDGSPGDGHSGIEAPALGGRPPAMSDDGRWVAFASTAENLVPQDTNEVWDVFMRDRTTGTTWRVSAGADGSQGWAASTAPAMSGSGRYLMMSAGSSTFPASGLVMIDRDTDEDGVFDEPGATRWEGVARRTSGSGISMQNWHLSRSGRAIGFEATNSHPRPWPDGTPGSRQAYARNLDTGVTRIVSVSAENVPALRWSATVLSSGGEARNVAVSDNGWAVFASDAANLTPDGHARCYASSRSERICTDVYVHRSGEGWCIGELSHCPFRDEV